MGNLTEEREEAIEKRGTITLLQVCGNKRKGSLEFTVEVTFDLSFEE